jgi:hypothetical protein
LANIPHTFGCPTLGVHILILIIIVHKNTLCDVGTSVEYNCTSCPYEKEGLLENIPNACGYLTVVVSILIWIMIVHKNTLCDVGICL